MGSEATESRGFFSWIDYFNGVYSSRKEEDYGGV